MWFFSRGGRAVSEACLGVLDATVAGKYGYTRRKTAGHGGCWGWVQCCGKPPGTVARC